MMSWTLVNLLDGEAIWFFKLLLYVAIAGITMYLVEKIVAFLSKYVYQETHPIQYVLIQAVPKPFFAYMWFFTILLCIDLVSDHFLSKDLHQLLLRAGALLTFTWTLMRCKRYFIPVIIKQKQSREGQCDVGKIHALSKLASLGITIITILIFLDITGQNYNTILAFGGISGLALAFAAQEIIANFFWGIMLHVNQPFGVGEFIAIPSSNLEGMVEHIGWYQTRLLGFDKRPVYLPNSLLSKTFVINSSRRTHRRVLITLSIRHEDISKSAAIVASIEQYIIQHPKIDKTSWILVNLGEITPYAAEISISAYSTCPTEKEFLKLRDTIIIEAVAIVQQHGGQLIGLPEMLIQTAPRITK